MHVEIPKAELLEHQVFNIHNEKEFTSIALSVYHFQFANNRLYRDYASAVYRTPEQVRQPLDIPFLPISFFKTHRVETTDFDPELIFKSSGTTGTNSSQHYLKERRLYEASFLQGFKLFYGNPSDYCILGLLPSYLERGQSSLVYMVDRLIKETGHPKSGFYLHEFERLDRCIAELEAAAQPTILIGVTYALLDFAEKFPRKLKHTIVMETGGMKGRKKEMTRDELALEMKSAFGVDKLHSEYGMTELLSQAYGRDGSFQTPPWMKVLLRDETDPFALYPRTRQASTGIINIIDLANLYSCSFIATEDIGHYTDTGFEVLGRMDHSDIRGCSLMTA